MNALIYAPSGGGKTVNSTLVRAENRKRNLLICTDNSSIVLRRFDRKNLDVINVSTTADFMEKYESACDSQKYDNIILDNLSDLFDMWLLELDDSGEYRDIRQSYQMVYQALKRLTRKSTAVNVNTIFTAWSDMTTMTMQDGTKVSRMQPKLPLKILDNVCGLMNVVAYVTSAMDGDTKRWYYITEGGPTLMAKDQLLCRKSCLPEDLFGGARRSNVY